MLNQLKLSLKYLFRGKVSSLANILSLSIGLSFVLLIISYLAHQSGYDKFWPNHENIFRIRRDVTFKGEKSTIALIDSKLIHALERLPSVEFVTGFIKIQDDLLFKDEDDSFIENNGLICDDAFLNVFALNLTTGSNREALKNPNNILISESFANRYLKNQNVIGEQLTIIQNGVQKQLQVAGVFDNLPTNSSLNFDFLISGPTFSYWQQLVDGMGSPFHAFILMQPSSSKLDIDQQLATLDKEIYEPSEIKFEDSAQNLDDLHVSSSLLFDFSKSINLAHFNILGSLGLLLMLLTIFNFISAMFSRASSRQGNYSISKIYGASNLIILSQLLIESVFFCELAFLISFLLTESILIPIIKNLTGLDLTTLSNLAVVAIFNLIFLAITVITTLVYSISIIRNSSLTNGLMSRYKGRRPFWNVRTYILMLQFGVTFTFILWSFVCYKQLHYLNNISLGYDKSNIVCLRHNSGIPRPLWQTLKSKLESSDQFLSVSGSQYKLIGDLNASILQKANNEIVKVMWNKIDYDFLPCLKIQLISGRNFSKLNPEADKTSIIINETAWRALGDSTILQAVFPIVNDSTPSTIIGVVKDFHFASFNNKIPPVVMSLKDDFNRFIYVKASGNREESIKKMRSIWKESQIDTHFEFELLDNSFESIVKDEAILEKVSFLFTFCAITLSLFGLILSSIQYINSHRRIFAIKKTLGASYGKLILQTNNVFIVKVLFGTFFFIPISYIAIESWLSNYAYRTSLLYIYFVLTVLSVLFISSVIVLISSCKLYTFNISDELREN
jgi:putative ABC transport system permease protein